eukprot:NODE_259_length_2814_cov_89.896693_g243_i0.p1 GENE.NODE_259_length_2814_cov_89.896693_g243_i0~~NODE_259_length_2814_cov_89.896693_g243_i0.p1  ORF type:complete len:889 (+),score=200.52 NODE_259_length_2814_cov_89.896693_g243_i0:59-2668(+)
MAMLEHLSTSNLKKAYRVEHCLTQIYSGGPYAISEDNKFLVLPRGNNVNTVDVETGKVIGTIEGDEEIVLSLALGPNDDDMVFTSRSLVMRSCSVKEQRGLKAWKGSDVPARLMAFHKDGGFFVAASAEGNVHIYDRSNKVAHKFFVDGQPLCLVFHPRRDMLLAVGCNSGKITIYDCQQNKVLHTVKAHFSHVPSLCFTPDGSTMVSVSHDKTIQQYSCEGFKPTKNLVVVDEMRMIACIDGTYAFVVGGAGKLHLLNIKEMKIKPAAATYPQAFEGVHYLPKRQELLIVTVDHGFLFYSMKVTNPGEFSLSLRASLAGNLDAVAEVRWLDERGERYLVCTNSNIPRVFTAGSSMCTELHGHTAMVGSVAISSDFRLAATAGKDMSIRVWYLLGAAPRCVAVLTGHIGHITSMMFTRVVVGRSSVLLLVSVDAEAFAKVWKLSALLPKLVKKKKAVVEEGEKKKKKQKVAKEESEEEEEEFVSQEIEDDLFMEITVSETTTKAHLKPITSVAISPNNQLVATGSKDKTIKMWKLTQVSLKDSIEMKGHRRGIMCVRFSTVDRVLASSCSYGTVKLWSTVDFNCLKTYQNDKGVGIYGVQFINAGIQLATTDAEGLLKLWVVKTAECVNAISGHSEEHTTREVWACDVTADSSYIITGGTDSTVNILKDFTEHDIQEELVAKQESVLETQKLQNLIRQRKWKEAILLALKLGRKNDLRNLIGSLMQTSGPVEGPRELSAIVRDLDEASIERLLGYAQEWNTHSGLYQAAHLVLQAVFANFHPHKLVKSDTLRAALEPYIAYTKRHCARLSGLLERTYLLDRALAELDPMSGSLLSIGSRAHREIEPVMPAVPTTQEAAFMEMDSEPDAA